MRFSSPSGYSHCMKILKTIPDHYASLGSANYRYEAKKKKQTQRTWKKLENLLPVNSFLLELVVVSNIGHVSLTTAFSSFLLILCSCFNKFLFTINWLLLLGWLIMKIKYWLKISSSKNYLVLLGFLTSCVYFLLRVQHEVRLNHTPTKILQQIFFCNEFTS